jgi:hypothetical protein
MKKRWILGMAMMLSVAVIVGAGWLLSFTRPAKAAQSFDLSGAWDMNYTVDKFNVPFDHHMLLNFTQQPDGTYVAPDPSGGSIHARVFSAMRPLNTVSSSQLLTSVAVTEERPPDPAHPTIWPSYAVWSGYDQYDVSKPETPTDLKVIRGYWTDFKMDSGQFELRPHTS